MEDKFERIKSELDTLIKQGDLLYYAMADEQDKLPEDFKSSLEEKGIKLPRFVTEYDTWYSEAIRVIKQIIPERYDDFVKQYKDDKRKEVSFINYGISDYLLGLRSTKGASVIAEPSAAITKMQIQNSILSSARKRFDSFLFDIEEVIQADLYDSELIAATDLSKKGFHRGAGAIAGVVLERHLKHICELHNLKSRKKKPTLADFYQSLKDEEIIDTPKWRFIQHLGDIRNLCDHPKDREPTKEDINELIEGVEKIIKTVY